MKKNTLQKQKFLKVLTLLFVFSMIINWGISQNMNCGFDDVYEQNMTNGSMFHDNFYENEETVIEAMNDPIMMGLIQGNSDYTIPVVVHVMHLGESEGVGSNIPDAQILQAIADLNAHFANTNGGGIDIGIQFCLAERDPKGDPTDGINRVNAANICAGACYGTSGITVGGPLDAAVKAASLWPNDDYINIWVVHSIVGALGYASFPGTSASTDGIVMDKDYFGLGGSNVLSHEAGHFFNLFHTFQGDCPANVNCNQNCTTATICPPNTPCDNDPTNDMTEICCRTQGDRVCDTPPHKRSCSDCNPTGTNTCDGGSSNSLFVHNYMDYSIFTCWDRFTDGQRTRMRCALMELRAPLMNSNGCTPACSSAVASFTGPDTGFEGDNLCFTNLSTGATEYLWEINSEEVSTDEDLCYTFDEPGEYYLCLTASNSNCTNKICMLIIIFADPPLCHELPECELLENGNFGIVTPNMSFHSGSFEFNRVCNWYNRVNSPSFYVNPTIGNTYVYYVNNVNNESMGTTTELDLVAGQEYELFFNYSVLVWASGTISDLPAMRVGLSTTLLAGGSNTIIYEAEDVPNDQSISSEPINIPAVNPAHICFTYEEGMGKYLFFDGIPGESFHMVVIQNVSVDECVCNPPLCDPNPEIIYDQDSCAFRFSAVNTGDPGTCYWDLGDGSTSDECDVEHEYLFGGTFNVCLTIACDEYTQETVCDSITVSADCEDCTELEINPTAIQCEEDSTGSYMTKIEFDIPLGTEPCGDGLFVWSQDAFVSVSSFDIENNSDSTDHVTACFNLTPYTGVNLEADGTTIYMTLCDSLGVMSCYNFSLVASSCQNCLGEFEVIAECIDSIYLDSTFVYGGTVEVDLPFGTTYSACDPTSTEINYEQSVTFAGNIATIDFTISTSNEGDFDASTILCFEVDSVEYCYILVIDIEPCPEPPTNCQEWGSKVTPAKNCEVLDGIVSYTVTMTNVLLSNSGLEPCNGEFIGTIGGGGSVEVTGSMNSSGNKITYTAVFKMPCGFDTSINYDLTIYLCDSEGNLYCLIFVIKFPDCDQGCEDGGGNDDDGGDNKTKNAPIANAVNVYPNPALHSVFVQVKNSTSKEHKVQIFDQLGRIIANESFENKIQIDLSDYTSGLHFVKVVGSNDEVISIKKLMIID